jgi:hypothetical protein
LALGTGVKVKSSANTDEDRGVQPGDVLSHPDFLLWSAYTHPYYVRADTINCLYNLFVFSRLEVAKRRRVDTYYFQPWESRLKTSGEPFGNSGSASVQEVAIPIAYGSFTQGEHQVRPIHTRYVMKALQPAQPDQWHTIRNNQPCAVMDISNSFFATGFHNAVHSRNTYVVRLVAQDPFVHGIQGHRRVYRADPNSKNVYSLGH